MAEYQFFAGALEQVGASVYALSTDPLEKAQETAMRVGAQFPMLYGVDGKALAASWGAYYEERRSILHATAFILHPNRTIASATYSTGPVGRLMPDEAMRMVAFYKRQAAQK